MTESSGQPSGPVAVLVGSCEVRLWSLDAETRLRRQLAAVGVPVAEAAADGPVLLVRVDYLFDGRTLADLAAAPGVGLVARDGGQEVPVAAHVGPGAVAAARAWLAGAGAAPPGLRVTRPEALSAAYVEALLKTEPPAVLPVRAAHRAVLERHLFDGAYKGVTDLVTKWLWPAPARRVVGWCARAGIAPNALTLTGLVLVIAATVLFARGQYGAGLLLAWVMTFFDTVDGKLARVTVQSSQFGHVLDHGIDIVHPPIWYLAWGLGLGAYGTPLDDATLTVAFVAIVAGYVAGRLVEGAFTYALADFSLFTWRPADSYFRLVTARRNPNLLLLTGTLLLGRPDWGLLAVAWWTVLSTAVLLVRLGMAGAARLRGEPLVPWLAAVRSDTAAPLARPFAPRPPARDLLAG